ncbi:MAG: hypothetical protein K8S14_09575 [Actinomycetia bacterium]|nr:hypothetical protein [Actinomycetes bacterium]
MSKKCIVIGDLNVDLILSKINRRPRLGSEILSSESLLDIGGSGGICSTVLSQLGIKTYIISKIGKDLYGDFLLNKLKKFGVKTDYIVVDSKKSTGLTINLSYPEDKYQISAINNLRNFSIGEISLKDIGEVDHIHFTSYFIMDGLKDKYLKIINEIKKINKNITFSLDTNDDPGNEWNGDLLNIIRRIDLLFLNKKEILNITKAGRVEKALDKLSDYVEIVIVKMGKEGSITKTPKNTYYLDSIESVFSDSTGAGDNFDAGFIYGFLNSYDFSKCLNIANICGAKNVENIGGVGSIKRFIKLRESIERLKNMNNG